MVPYEGRAFQDIDVRLMELSNDDLQAVLEYDEVHEMEQARQLQNYQISAMIANFDSQLSLTATDAEYQEMAGDDDDM